MVPDGTGVSLLETTLAPADSEAAASNPTLVPRSIAVHSMERYPGVQFRETRNQPLTPSGCASETACSTPSMVQPSPCSGFLPAGKSAARQPNCGLVVETGSEWPPRPGDLTSSVRQASSKTTVRVNESPSCGL